MGLIQPDEVIRHSRSASLGWTLASRSPRRIRTYLAATVPPPRVPKVSGLTEANVAVRRGYFQDPEVFFEYRDIYREEIERSHIGATRRVVQSRLPRRFSAIHVRRGDYVAVPRNSMRLGVCSTEYFASAARHLSSELPIVVVTDDPEWCRSYLLPRLPRDARIFDGSTDIDDFAALSSASEIVTSNSTFSWWAAFGGNPSTVVVPEPWFDAPDAGGDRLKMLGTVVLDKGTGVEARV